MTSPSEITARFVAHINAQDVHALASVMTVDHRLIDPGGTAVVGAAAVRDAWAAYFRMIPDYRVDVTETFVQEDVVVMVGGASGTYAPDGKLAPERRWHVPAAWRAVVRNGRVAEWQVYADNEPLRTIIAATEREE